MSGDSAQGRRLLVAPDSFKGTFSASVVAQAISAGAARGGWWPDLCPVADGGDGTMAVLVAAGRATMHAAAVAAPLGERVVAQFAITEDGCTAILETAQASGLTLTPADRRDPERASTFGTGELMVAARRAGARAIVLGAGGSATTDGGAGALEAIAHAGGLGGVPITVLCDVRTPYEEAARVFGPQKGAGREAVERLTARLHHLAQTFPRDPRGRPMTGCAGGLSGGLWAVLGAELVHGSAAVLDAVGFDGRLEQATAVVVGEGRLDDQSLTGKVTGEIVRRCRRAGKPVHAIVGSTTFCRVACERAGLASVALATTLLEIEHAAGLLGDAGGPP